MASELVVFGSVSQKTLFDSGLKKMSGYLVQGLRDLQYVFQYVSPDHHVDGEEEVGSELAVKLSHQKTKILASCRKSGLLLCERMVEREHEHDLKQEQDKYTYSVCKPATGQSQQLPKHDLLPWEIVSASFLTTTTTTTPALSFKIVLLWTRVIGNSYKCKVFDSEAWAWRDGKDECYLPIGGKELILKPSLSSPVVTAANNSIYWLTTQDNVVEFCLPKNSFGKKFALPGAVLCNGHKRLVEYRGGLGLVCVREGDGCSELWLKDEASNAWKKEMEVQGAEEHTHPVGFYSPEMALFVSTNEVLYYKLGGGGGGACSLIRKVPTRWLGMPHRVFPFVSDSEPVRLGPPAS